MRILLNKKKCMKNLILSIILSTICLSCIDSNSQAENQDNSVVDFIQNIVASPQPEATFDSIASGLQFNLKGVYTATKQEIENKRVFFSKAYTKSSTPTEKEKILNEASSYFTKAILNDIIPYWYGTEWDFNGHTNIPNEGEVACGYFVSTTLKHMGLQLNRYTMAQQASKLAVASIAIQKNKMTFFRLKNSSEQLKKLKDGLYIVGLDNHVGYVYNVKGTSYFLHSSYITDRVMIELANRSDAFTSNVYYLASITDNKELIKKWILGKKLAIKTQ